MTEKNVLLRLVALAAVLCVSACGGSEDVDGGTDPADGGVNPDSGDGVTDVVTDAGPDAGLDAETGDDVGPDSDSGNDIEVEPSGPVEAAPRPPLTSFGGAACVLDADCAVGLSCFLNVCSLECDDSTTCPGDEVCSDRGRCLVAGSRKDLDGSSAAANPDTLDGVRFVEFPARQQIVDAGVTVLEIEAPVEGDIPETGIAYRVETAEDDGPPEILRASVRDGLARFSVPTGAANPLSPEPGLQNVSVVSAAGTFRVSLIPRSPASGLFVGQTRMTRFGNMPLPMEFMIVTEPADATLDEATEAWLLLPVGADQILSPRNSTDDAEWQAVALNFDSFVGRWVARYDNVFEFSAGSLLSGYDAGQVGRTIRVELELEPGVGVIGSITDRWTGLYDARNESGVLESAVVSFDGVFEAQRVGAALPRSEFNVEAPEASSSELLPLPSLDACVDAMLGVSPRSVNGVSYGCDGITSLAAFEAAAAEDRASCAIAVAETALAGETTVDLLGQFLDGDEVTPGGESFADFMERCAEGIDGACRPSAEALCGRQLTAYAYVEPTVDVSSAGQLVETFQSATREAFLGRQLGAFQTDAQKRLEWLQTSDWPSIVTSALVDLNEQLLNEWIEGVLDVHFEVLAGQFDTAGLAVLSRQPSQADAIARRRTLLFDMTQGWRAAMEATTLATQRLNTLYQEDVDRAEASVFVAERMVDLYVLAGLAGNLNLSAGSGFANATFGGGFAGLQRELRKLSLPFNELIYARDAEIVVSTSLDPESSNNTVLRDLETLARGEIGDAAGSVTDILAEAQARALNETQLRNQLANDIEEARNTLVELCGLPVGCSVADYGVVDDCEVRTEAGQCGFAIDRFSEALENFEDQPVTVSDAGRAMLAVLDAANNYRIAESEAAAHEARTANAYQDLAQFQATVEAWNDARESTLSEIDGIIVERQDEWNDTLVELTTNMAERETLRAEQIQNARDDQRRWEDVREEGRIVAMGSLITVNALRAVAQYNNAAAEETLRLGQIAKEGFPTVVGLANDPSSVGRVSVLMAAFTAASASRTIATVAETSARVIEQGARVVQARYDARVLDIQQETAFDDRQYAADLAALQDEAQLIQIEQGVRDADVDRLIAQVQRAIEVELAYERDLVELQDRRSEVFGMVQQSASLQLRMLEAEFDIQQRVFEYLQIVQRAELLESRLAELENQRQNVNLLLGSPSVVFAWANRLQQAEQRLERAKSALLDWLVAMEYFAVRPFMDQRIQILLARNTYQLEDIAAEMDRLQRSCGGPLSEQSSTVALTSLLGVEDPFVDSADDQLYTPAERLRAVFERGAVPIDTRTRYSTGESIGDLLNRGEVWSATVNLDISRFANLASTCNAKIVSFDVQLVGEDLGNAQPTITILYDGTSRLRSCQPGISDYVEQFGPEATSFNEITTFRTPARSVSPVAGINAFPSDSGGTGNLSLAGLPLASQYTVLIDRQLGENININWDRVQDVLLRVNYAYQDVFPVGQCE